VIRGRIVCRCGGKYGRAVDENIQAAELRFNTAKHVFDGGGIPQVRLKHGAIAAGNLLCFNLAGSVMDSDPRSSSGELERDLPPDPFCGAGD